MSITIVLKCRQHPAYMGVRYPTAPSRGPDGVLPGSCEGCWGVYQAKRLFNGYNRVHGINLERLAQVGNVMHWMLYKIDPRK